VKVSSLSPPLSSSASSSSFSSSSSQDTFQKEGGAGRRLNLKRKKKETLEEINQSEGVEHTWSHQEDINYLGFLVSENVSSFVVNYSTVRGNKKICLSLITFIVVDCV
jgi:hypothetical protein